MLKRFIVVSLLTVSSYVFGQTEELKKEAERLEKLRNDIKSEYAKNQEILKQIKEERQKLEQLKKEFEEQTKKIKDERYQKLAKVFEKMDPEEAGKKISKAENPQEIAFILYNMNEKKAAAILNNTDPDMVNKILKYLTLLKEQSKP
ncbi:MAG: hypothetical protein N2Z81_06310 [Hydrogenothermaceae bacterium]|nr:hypothetical protein [Hydrogenothermaceae bacterium]